jgi:hypothetical protein
MPFENAAELENIFGGWPSFHDAEVSFEWFNHQNVLWSLDIEDIPPAEHDGRRFRVELPSSYGLEATFECERAIVSGVRPYEAGA